MSETIITKMIEKPNLLCTFCYSPCWVAHRDSLKQMTMWACDQCPFDVSYNLYWGSDNPHSYSIYCAYKGKNYCLTIQFLNKRWKVSSMLGPGPGAQGESVIASGFFDEPPDINPGNVRDKLLFYLTFS